MDHTGGKKKREKRIRCRTVCAAVLFSVSALLLLSARYIPGFAQWYSLHVYAGYVSTVGRISGMFPFSVSEIGIYCLLILFLFSFIFTLRKTVRRKTGKDRFVLLKSWGSSVLLVSGILFFLYTAGCGINYSRDSFSECSGIPVRAYGEEELREVCLRLTGEVNSLSTEVQREKDGQMATEDNVREEAVRAMNSLAQNYPALEGFYPEPKELLFSEVLSVQGLSGIYLPFTAEANYNGDMTDYNIPFTACHELSHLRGFMQEQEANFIAFLACTESDRTDFRYSGYLSGWVYCMNALYRADPESWEEVRACLSPEAECDLEANSAFWSGYDGMIAETADRINDTYLKANGQQDGVESYGKMVDLIVSYFMPAS